MLYVVLYVFKVKPNQDKVFIESWKGLTRLIHKYEGSLGSRLHKEKAQNYIAYAQWPSKTKFESSGKNLPKEANSFRDLMRESCEEIEILHKLEMVEDLLDRTT